jgi:hypothetical protein
MPVDQPDPPAEGPMTPRWDITVAKPVAECNVMFVPGHKYRVSQRVYDEIKNDCATAAVVAEGEP